MKTAWEKCGASYMHWPPSYKLFLPQKIQLFVKAKAIRNWHLCFQPIVLAWLEKCNWKLFILAEQLVVKAVLYLVHFIVKINIEELSHLTVLILCTSQKPHSGTIFTSPWLEASMKDKRNVLLNFNAISFNSV